MMLLMMMMMMMMMMMILRRRVLASLQGFFVGNNMQLETKKGF